jgi:hypothetical protein
MKTRLLFLFLIPSIVVAAGISGGQAFRNIARAWLLDPPSANTFVPSQYGMGWSDSKFTLRTPPGNLQFSTTGSPAEPVMTWPGRITASHIDVTSMSLFTTPPATLASAGTAGQMAYDANYFYLCTALNTWKSVPLNQSATAAAPVWDYLDTNQINNNGTANTLESISGLSIEVVPGTYWFRFTCHYDSAATTTGSRWSITGPTTSALSYHSRYSLTTTTQTTNNGLSAYDLPAASNLTSVAAGNLAVIEGIATFTAGGVLTPRFASEISASAVTVKAGSNVQFLKLY